MNQNNLGDGSNLASLRSRSSLLMLDTNGNFEVIFSDTDHERVKKLESRLKELQYETVVYLEVFRDGAWEQEANVSMDTNVAPMNNSSLINYSNAA